MQKIPIRLSASYFAVQQFEKTPTRQLMPLTTRYIKLKKENAFFGASVGRPKYFNFYERKRHIQSLVERRSTHGKCFIQTESSPRKIKIKANRRASLYKSQKLVEITPKKTSKMKLNIQTKIEGWLTEQQSKL